MARRRTGGKNGRMTPRVTPRSVVQTGATEGPEIDQAAIEQNDETEMHIYTIYYWVAGPKHKPQEHGHGRQIMQSPMKIKTLPDFVAFELFCKQSIQQDLPQARQRSAPVLTCPPHYLGTMTLGELKALRVAGEQS